MPVYHPAEEWDRQCEEFELTDAELAAWEQNEDAHADYMSLCETCPPAVPAGTGITLIAGSERRAA